MNNKGLTLSNLGNYQQAITWLDKAIKQTESTGNTDINIVSNKAYDLGIRLKEYDNALSLIEDYLKRSPGHRGPLCTTAEIYNETGYVEIARHYKEQLGPYYNCGLIEEFSRIEKEAFA